MVNERKDLT